MANFLDIIKQQAASMERDDDDERVQPKNGYIEISKKKPVAMLRIVPSLTYLQTQEGDPVGFGYRSIFFNTPHRKQDGSFASANLVIGDDKESYDIVNTWVKDGRTPTQYGNQNIRTNYLINAIELDPQTLNPITGHVQVMRVTYSTYKQLVEQLADKMNWAPNSQMGYMDFNAGQPVKITKPTATGEKYQVQVYPTHVLPAITDINGLMADMEDLSQFAQPTRLAASSYFNSVVEWMDEANGGQTTQAPSQPAFGGTNNAPQTNPYVQQGQPAFGVQPQQGAPVQTPAPSQAPVQQPAFGNANSPQQSGVVSNPAFSTPQSAPAVQPQQTQAPTNPGFGGPSATMPGSAPAFASQDTQAPAMPAQQPQQSGASTGEPGLDAELDAILKG